MGVGVLACVFFLLRAVLGIDLGLYMRGGFWSPRPWLAHVCIELRVVLGQIWMQTWELEWFEGGVDMRAWVGRPGVVFSVAFACPGIVLDMHVGPFGM